MSQNYTDDLYSQATVADTCLANMENNFAALKSCFSGGSAPSNPVAGMWWFDTNNDILKIRNEANNAWLNVYDFTNTKPYNCVLETLTLTAGVGISGGGDLSANRTFNHDSHTGEVTGSTSLTIAANVIGLNELKYTNATGGRQTPGQISLPGGAYGFAIGHRRSGGASAYTLTIADGGTDTSFSYTVDLAVFAGSPYYVYIQQYYVQSSGELHWIFLLREKTTGQYISIWEAPDHPGFGHKGMVHPFKDYNPKQHDIIVVNPTIKTVEKVRAGQIPKKEGGYMTLAGVNAGEKENYNKESRTFFESFFDMFEVDEHRETEYPDTPSTIALPRIHGGKIIKDWRFYPQTDKDGKPIKVKPIKETIKKPDFITCLKYKEK